MVSDKKTRCPWCGNDPLYVTYHDHEWGVPLTDDQKLFEFLVLEGAQAGLSWLTVLRKRENFRRAFAGFDPDQVARFGDLEIAALLADAGIIRNRLKVTSAIHNARRFLEVREEFGTFATYIWGFVDSRPLVNRWTDPTDLPARTPLSDRISADLRRRGFTFVGSTIVYAHMQATGMVNDHLTGCFRHRELEQGLFPPPGLPRPDGNDREGVL